MATPSYTGKSTTSVDANVRWADDYPEPRERGQRPTWSGHRLHRFIRGTAETMDMLEVFRLDKGSVARWFGQPLSVTLYPLASNAQWSRASMRDLDMINQDTLPDEGLLKDEPGSLLYIAPRDARDDLPGLGEAVDMTLGVEAEVFDRLLDDLSRVPGRITSVRLSTLVEGWQDHMEAFLAPPGAFQVIGLLATGEHSNTANARVRLESATVTFAVPVEGIDRAGDHTPDSRRPGLLARILGRR